MTTTTRQFTHGSKTALAKLLASENIRVMHGNYQTASFDLKNRVMRLPQFVEENADVYDLMVSHEVSHALNTGMNDWTHGITVENLPPSVLNVLEDVRIEKMIQRKFPGLVSVFTRGYNELAERKFFGEFDPAQLNLIDKINVKAKLKSDDVQFDSEEIDFYNRSLKTETWDEVVELAKDLMEYMKEKQQEQQSQTSSDDQHGSCADDDDDQEEQSSSSENNQQSDSDNDSDDNGSSSSSSSQQSEESNDDDNGGNNSSGNESNENQSDEEGSCNTKPGDEESTETESGNQEMTNDSRESDDSDDSDQSGNQQGGKEAGKEHSDHDQFESKTDKAFRENEEKMNELNKEDISDVMWQLNCFSKKEFYDNVVFGKDWIEQFDNLIDSTDDVDIKVLIDNYNAFMKNNKHTVSAMVQKFELKKNAATARKTRQSVSGAIDPLKLHSYKFNEEIFKSITIQPDGQNHGILFIVDFSGSMSSLLEDVIIQVLILTEFCRKQNIKYEVYGFTSKGVDSDRIIKRIEQDSTLDVSDNLILADRTHIVQMLSSDMTKRETTKATAYLFNYFVHSQSKFIDNDHYEVHQNFGSLINWSNHETNPFVLSCTPLNETLIGMHYIAADFIAKHKVTKMSGIVLTDGEGGIIDSTVGMSLDKETGKYQSDASYDRRPGRYGFYDTARVNHQFEAPITKRLIVANKHGYCTSSSDQRNELILSLKELIGGPVIAIDLVKVSKSRCYGYHKMYGEDNHNQMIGRKEPGYAVITDKDSETGYRQRNYGYTMSYVINTAHSNNKTKNHYSFMNAVQEQEKKSAESIAAIKRGFITDKRAQKAKNVIFTGIAETVAAGL